MARYKQLLACPRCENNGRRYILGELAPSGHILIQRVHGNNGQYRNFTIVGGNDFYLVCDNCGEKVYFKRIEGRNYESSNERISWVYRQSFEGTVGTIGAYGGTT
jgi:hypothetical protein